MRNQLVWIVFALLTLGVMNGNPKRKNGGYK